MRAHALIDRRPSVDDAEATARAVEERPDDLVWPPPADDLDRVEVVALQSGDAADPPRRDDHQRPPPPTIVHAPVATAPSPRAHPSPAPEPPASAPPVAPPLITVAAARGADSTASAAAPIVVDLPASDDDVDAFRDEAETGVLPWHDVEVRPRHAPRPLRVAAVLVVAAVAGVAVGGQVAGGRWEGWARQSAAVTDAAKSYWQAARASIANAVPGEAPTPTPVQVSTDADTPGATAQTEVSKAMPGGVDREAAARPGEPSAAERGLPASQTAASTSAPAADDAAAGARVPTTTPASPAGDGRREATRVADVASAAVPRPTSPPLSQQVGGGGGAASTMVATPVAPVDRDARRVPAAGAGPGATVEAPGSTTARGGLTPSAGDGAAASRAVETPTARPADGLGAAPAPEDVRSADASSAVAPPPSSSPAPLSSVSPSVSAGPPPSAERELTPPAAVAITPAATQRRDESQVRTVLARYATAYGQLDAGAAQAVWPSVDARALSRAFSGLESQSLQFSRCDLDVRASVARAECLGRATYVTRVGSKAPRSVSRTWSFQLRKVGEGWQIVDAATR